MLLTACGLGLAGCGGGGGGRSETLTVATHHGLTYRLEIADAGTSQECATSSYRTALPDGRPITQGAHACGRSALYGYPLLVQAHGSGESMVVDVPKTSCGVARAKIGQAAPRILVSRCTPTAPRFRVTLIPQARRLTLTGIPGAPALNFPRHVCKSGICLTVLA